MVNSKKYNIGDITLFIESDCFIKTSHEFNDFDSCQNFAYKIRFHESKVLQYFQNPIFKDSNIEVFKDKKGYVRQYNQLSDGVYAQSFSDYENKNVDIFYLRKGENNINHDNGAFFHIGWEDILLNENRLLLHACCIETHLGGICFSGPSGIGKSTQGDLWRKYENATLINGDRPILYKDNQKWFGYGSPYAGSSKVHINRRTPLKAIILLEQSKACSIKKLEGIKAFQKIFSQLTISHWNKDMVNKACCLVEQLINDIPIYELSCTPDKDAVDLLKSTLLGGVD